MAYDTTNIFARILRGEIPCKKIFENTVALAFEDIAPSAPTHILVIPKGPYTSFDDFVTLASADFIKDFFKTIQEVAGQMGLAEGGYRLITNHGPHAQQSVPHFHVHIVGGAPLGPLLALPGE